MWYECHLVVALAPPPPLCPSVVGVIETAEKNHLQLVVGRKGGGGGSRVETDEKNHLQLVFGCKGGGGGGIRVKTMKITTSSSHLDAREVVVPGGGRWSKRRKKTTSSSQLNEMEVVWWQAVEIMEETTSNSHSDTREVVMVAQAVERTKKNHLQLAFGCEGGGSGGRWSKQSKEPPPAHV